MTNWLDRLSTFCKFKSAERKKAYDSDGHAENWCVEDSWCSMRLFHVEKFDGWIVDPAAGCGRVIAAAREAGYEAAGFDLKRELAGQDLPPCLLDCADFMHTAWSQYVHDVQNIVCNPPLTWCENGASWQKAKLPYGKGFVGLALKRAARKVAMLLPMDWAYDAEHSKWLRTTPLKTIYELSPRPSMPPGTVLAEFLVADKKPGCGAEDLAWYVWEHGCKGTPILKWLHRDDGIDRESARLRRSILTVAGDDMNTTMLI